ncbi:MAG: hypothetical protein ACR2PZ_13005 [Pseudomonadales bacterium]
MTEPVGPVAQAFAAYPAAPRKRLLQLRKLLLKTALSQEGVGPIDECLRWGEPSYLTSSSGSGSMLRLHWKPTMGQSVGLFVHCQTRLISEYKARYPEFKYDGKRALLIPIAGRLPAFEIADCMALALTYRLRR